jgi:uncharacterized glyoxalase superfamily protein PhnB
MSARYIPEGQSPIAPYFLVEDAEGMISFLKSAFGAEERQRIVEADSLIKHAELSIDGATVFVGARARRNENSTHLYIRDVDATYTLCLSLELFQSVNRVHCLMETGQLEFATRTGTSGGSEPTMKNKSSHGTPSRVAQRLAP